jgi:PAS domain S-box-containing protein
MRFFFGAKNKSQPSAPIPRVAQPQPEADPLPSAPSTQELQMPSAAEATQPSQKEILRVLTEISNSSTKPVVMAATGPLPLTVQSAAADAGKAEAEKKEKVRDISLYKSLLAGLYDGVLIFDAKGYVIASNQRIMQFMGYDEEELWNMPCDKLISAVTPRVLAKITAYVEAGRFTVVNADCRRKDGTVFPAEIAISRIRFLQDGDFIFSIRNLDRREKARMRHELECDALRYSCSGIAVCTLEGLIEYVNPTFVRLLNVPGEQVVIRRSIGQFCVSPEAALDLVHITVTEGFWFGRLELRAQDGIVRTFIATGGLCPAKHDVPARIVLTLTALPKTIT